MEKQLLVQWEQEALYKMNHGDIEGAIQLFKKILEVNPNYEHGLAFYNLAGCLEDIKEYKQAEENYLKALEYGPYDTIILGGYASFLYLHGDTQKAFDYHLLLLKEERKFNGRTDDLINVLNELGLKLNFSEKEINSKIYDSE
jgi:tetratricopeptide (TPR) repeat protein